MTQASKHHRTTAEDIVFAFWLAFSPDGDVKLTKGSPSLSPRQRAMQVEARLPKSLWNIPSLSAEIVVPDPGQPDAIAARIEATRRIERLGVATAAEMFAGLQALPAPGSIPWWDVLQVRPDATVEMIEAAFRRLARDRHPDRGGSHDMMADLNRARDAALKERA